MNEGVDVINMSLGSTGTSATKKQAMDDAYNAGIILVAAAGNNGGTAYSYPASYDSVIRLVLLPLTAVKLMLLFHE